MPAPWLGVQVSPSLSEKAMRLIFVGRSCETKVRLVRQSVKRIGSNEVIDVESPERSLQVAVPLASSKSTRRVSRPEMNIVRPVDQLLPRVGSPASRPSAVGGTKLV